MATAGHQGWQTLHGEGNRVCTDDGRLYLRYQVRVTPHPSTKVENGGNGGKHGWRFLEEYDEDHGPDGRWMIVAFDGQRRFLGQSFGRTKAEARRRMDGLFESRGLSRTGLTF